MGSGEMSSENSEPAIDNNIDRGPPNPTKCHGVGVRNARQNGQDLRKAKSKNRTMGEGER